MKIPSVSRNIPFLFPLFCFKCSGTSPKGPHTSSFEGLTGQCPGTPAWPPRPRELAPGSSRCAFETARGSHFEQGLETKRGAGGLANVASHGDEGPSFAASRTRLAAVTSVSAGSGPGRRGAAARPARAPGGSRRRSAPPPPRPPLEVSPGPRRRLRSF